MPYVSKSANAKLIFRAIALKDEKLLKKLLKDKQNIYQLYNKSVDFDLSPVEATLKANNLALFKILLEEFCGNKFDERKFNNYEDRVSLGKLDTGHYNPKSLGVSRILKIQASRGSKEGNNAFLKSERICSLSGEQSIFKESLIPHGVPDHFVEELMKFKDLTEEQFYSSIQGGYDFIDLLLMGCHKVAGKIVKHSNPLSFEKAFNQLIKEILMFETEELSSCPPSAVKFSVKKMYKLTPFHYAAINPNPKYLERLLSVEPLAHISDMRGRRPIHFAACCSSTDNLELLFKWGANVYETCQNHKLPLHYAIDARRPKNVKVLLERASKNADTDISMKKFGPGGINRPFPNGMSPLHRAVELEEREIVELLLSYGAPVNAKSSVSSMQVTALMAAAATGNLDSVKLLVEHGAVVEQKDRLGRTALIHACRNGATKVLSYLIHIGSNPERPDSSENYPLHYAAAYGWFFTVQFLIDVGVDINVLNMWKFSPVSLAFVKGHAGIVRQLLMNEKVHINQTMEDGTSLLFQACESDLCQDDLYEQIEYLVKKKGAMCNIKDVNGKTALFYLAQSQIKDQDMLAQAQEQSIRIANLLIDHGCDISAVDNEGFTAAMAALGCMANLPLAEALIKKGCKVLSPPKTGPVEKPKDSLLHVVVKKLNGNEGKALQVLQLLKKHKFEKEAKESASHVNSSGYTPLLFVCTEWTGISNFGNAANVSANTISHLFPNSPMTLGGNMGTGLSNFGNAANASANTISHLFLNSSMTLGGNMGTGLSNFGNAPKVGANTTSQLISNSPFMLGGNVGPGLSNFGNAAKVGVNTMRHLIPNTPIMLGGNVGTGLSNFGNAAKVGVNTMRHLIPNTPIMLGGNVGTGLSNFGNAAKVRASRPTASQLIPNSPVALGWNEGTGLSNFGNAAKVGASTTSQLIPNTPIALGCNEATVLSNFGNAAKVRASRPTASQLIPNSPVALGWNEGTGLSNFGNAAKVGASTTSQLIPNTPIALGCNEATVLSNFGNAANVGASTVSQLIPNSPFMLGGNEGTGLSNFRNAANVSASTTSQLIPNTPITLGCNEGTGLSNFGNAANVGASTVRQLIPNSPFMLGGNVGPGLSNFGNAANVSASTTSQIFPNTPITLGCNLGTGLSNFGNAANVSASTTSQIIPNTPITLGCNVGTGLSNFGNAANVSASTTSQIIPNTPITLGCNVGTGLSNFGNAANVGASTVSQLIPNSPMTLSGNEGTGLSNFGNAANVSANTISHLFPNSSMTLSGNEGTGFSNFGNAANLSASTTSHLFPNSPMTLSGNVGTGLSNFGNAANLSASTISHLFPNSSMTLSGNEGTGLSNFGNAAKVGANTTSHLIPNTPIMFGSNEGTGLSLHQEGPSSFASTEKEKSRDEVLDFFKCLIAISESVNAKVAEKFITPEERLSVTSLSQKYANVQDGGKTALHLLLHHDPQFHLVETKSATIESLIIQHLLEKGANIDYHDIQGMTPLGTAIQRGFTSTVDYLVKHTKCNINLPIKIDNRNGKQIEEHPHLYAVTLSPIRHAHTFNALHMFSTLIDCGIDVNARSQVEGNHNGTFLHLLLQDENQDRSEVEKIIDKLSQTSFDFDAQDNTGKTVLHYALRSNKSQLNDSLELESKLLAKCSLRILDKKQRTALHYVFRKKKRSGLHWKDETKENPSQLLRFICQKADKSILTQQDHDGKTILHMAAELGHFVCIYLLTKNKYSLNINLKDNDGNTPLSLAVRNGHDSCALALIQCDASLRDEVMTVSNDELRRRKEERKKIVDQGKEGDEADGTDEEENDSDQKEEGWNLKAFQTGKKEQTTSREHLFKATLEYQLAGTLLQILDAPRDKSGLTPQDMIWMTMEKGKYNIALQMMRTSFSDPKSANLLISSYEMGRTLLHLLPLSSENCPREDYSSFIEIAKWLISTGISSSSIDNYGCTPIHYAILNRHLELATLLAENGSGFDVSKKDNFGRGYLAAILWRIHSKGVDTPTWNFLEKLITEQKLNLDTMIDLPLCPDILEMEANNWNIQKDPDYWQRYPGAKTTALIVAISCSKFEQNVSHNLLQFGANPNTPDGNNISPLMHAVMQNKVHFVRQLLHYDYDPNAREMPNIIKASREQKNNILNTGGFLSFRPIAAELDEASEESEDDTAEEQGKEKKDESCVKAFKPVKKTSSVELDQKDGDGRTALHYVASPSPLGTFDNAELAFVLIKGGSKSATDKFGFTPFTLAAETCATNVIEQLKLLGHGTNRSIKIQYKDNFVVDDGINFAGKQDFMKDAEKVLQRHDSGMDVDDVFIHEVDENCNVTNGELMKDQDMDIWFDILLTIVDVKRLEWGLYNFYKLQAYSYKTSVRPKDGACLLGNHHRIMRSVGQDVQLVYQPDKKLYILFTRWGRIGETGQFQHTPFHDEAAAIKEFAKIFREKSGNQWIDIKKYERKPKKYRLLEDLARKAPPKQKDVDLDLKSNVRSTLPQHLYLLVHTLMSPKVMQVSMKTSTCINTASLPFGQLNKERLMQGKQLLERIEKYIAEVEECKKSLRTNDVDKEKMEVIEKNCELIAELSNDYFHVIPQQNFSCERCEPLNAQTIIQHLYFISNMLNYEIVSKMLLAAMTHKSKTNPVDFVYRCLGCRIELMQEDDAMSQLILRYVHLSSKKKVLRIYKLSREGEEERLKATQIGNHHLLWHGTQSTNLLSILTRGMLVSPPEANHASWAFGRGVYFADEFCKSDNYVGSYTGRKSFMLLCQVALGNCVPYEYPDALPETRPHNKKPKNSTVVESNAHQIYDWLVLNTGAKIPYLKQGSFIRHMSREYIVENPAQICLRYLIEYI